VSIPVGAVLELELELGAVVMSIKASAKEHSILSFATTVIKFSRVLKSNSQGSENDE
jgi:hypothetical protein